MFLEYLLLYCYTINSTAAPAITTTTEYDPLLLPLVLLVQQRMSPHIYQVFDSPLLCHDHPTTSLLKEGPGLYQLHLMQPQAWPSLILSRNHDWGWETVESTLHPATRKALQYLGGQSPLKGSTLPHIPVPKPLAQWLIHPCH